MKSANVLAHSETDLEIYIGTRMFIGRSATWLRVTRLSYRLAELVDFDISERPFWRGKELFLPARANISRMAAGTRFFRSVEVSDSQELDVLVGSDLLGSVSDNIRLISSTKPSVAIVAR